MNFWVFCHDVLNVHVYYFLSGIVALVMGVSLVIQKRNQKKRDNDAKDNLQKKWDTTSSEG